MDGRGAPRRRAARFPEESFRQPRVACVSEDADREQPPLRDCLRGARGGSLAVCDASREDASRDAERSGPCTWAVEIGGVVVAAVGLVPSSPRVARVHAFHVDPVWQHTSILAKLLRQLYGHCHSQGYERLTLNPRIAPPWIWRLFVRSGFRLLRKIRGPGGELLEFALAAPPRTALAPQE